MHCFVLLGVSSIQLKLNRDRAERCILISEFRFNRGAAGEFTDGARPLRTIGSNARVLSEDSSMNPVRASELVFEVTEETEGGYSAECLTENIFTQGKTWEELRANVKEATEAYFYDGPKPKYLRLHLVRDELLTRG